MQYIRNMFVNNSMALDLKQQSLRLKNAHDLHKAWNSENCSSCKESADDV